MSMATAGLVQYKGNEFSPLHGAFEYVVTTEPTVYRTVPLIGYVRLNGD